MSMAEAAAQRLAIETVNARYEGRFRLLQGIEANIDATGQLDLTADEASTFDVVLAAPHSNCERTKIRPIACSPLFTPDGPNPWHTPRTASPDRGPA
jgi:histidinol phosphatase-like PHP family hydrolase